MRTYKRTAFNLIKSIIIAPVTGTALYLVAGIFIPSGIICAAIGLAAAAVLLYMAFFSENIYFELDDDGAFRYCKRGKVERDFTLTGCRVGYRRKSESGIFGNHNINLQILDERGEEHFIDAAPIGVDQFMELFTEMEKYAIKDEPLKAEPLRAGKWKS
jgi:hypothetical protein